MKTPAALNPNRHAGKPAPSPVGFENVPAVEKPIELPIQGKIPSWVNGVLYRSGTGRYNVLLNNGDTHHITHPFDGLAMLHRFRVSGETQTVEYCSRHTSHGLEQRIRDEDKTLLTFGPDPCKTIFGRMQTFYHHVSSFNEILRKQEEDPEFDLVNVTITPNFPIGPRLEKETGVKRGEAVVVKRDANTLQLVDKDTLKPLRMFQYQHIDKKLWGLLCASHHQSDEDTNEYINFMLRLGPIPSFQLFSLSPYLPVDPDMAPPTTRLYEPIWRHLGSWKTTEVLKPSYIHSFNMTKNYIIIPNFPYYYTYGGLSAIYYSSAYQTFYWEENRHTLFHVIDRHSGRHIATYEADPCFGFHSANAWDEDVELPGGGRERVIYLDYCMYENTDIVDASFELGKSPSGKVNLDQVQPARYVIKKKTQGKRSNKIAPSQVRRYRLGNLPRSEDNQTPWSPDNLTGGYVFSGMLEYNQRRVASYTVLAHDVELPRFDQRRNLKPYRYLWGVCESKFAPSYASGAVVNGLIKVDLDRPYPGPNTDAASSALIWDEPGCSCSEPVFVPNPDGEAEDDGVVLSVVNTSTSDGKASCFLLILDASNMKELGRSVLGSFNTMTLHGSFVDSRGISVATN